MGCGLVRFAPKADLMALNLSLSLQYDMISLYLFLKKKGQGIFQNTMESCWPFSSFSLISSAEFHFIKLEKHMDKWKTISLERI